MMRRIAVIADDLTGAADAGVQFSPYFHDNRLVSSVRLAAGPAPISAGIRCALSIYTGSRALPSPQARNRLRDLTRKLSRMPLDFIYKKVDSCLRGNLGAEIEAVMETLEYDLSFIAPAFPAMGRTTVDGIHRVHDVPVHLTEMGSDPTAPVVDSVLSSVVASQAHWPVGSITLPLLEQSQQFLQEEIKRLSQRGLRHIVFDATSRQHLECIARTALAVPYRVLLAGSAGLAAAMDFALPEPDANPDVAGSTVKQGPHLLVCGSAAQVAQDQVDRLADAHSYRILSFHPRLLADTSKRVALEPEIKKARRYLERQDLIVRVTPPAKVPAASIKFPASHGDRIVKGLAWVCAQMLSDRTVAGLYLTGGDTACAVLEALGVDAIRLLGEVTTGLVRGEICGGVLDGTAVATKAGAFGRPGMLLKLHTYWHQ